MNRGIPLLVLFGVLAAAGCADTELQGVIVDEDIFDPALMLPMVRGINSELTDNFRDFEGITYYHSAPTDELTNDGVSRSEEEISVGDFRDREHGDFLWEQLHESAWAGYKGVQTLQEVLGNADAATNPVTAQAWFISGVSERFLGETFCELVYAYGPDGGPLLKGDASHYDASRTVPRDSAFKRSLAAFQEALVVAEAAVAADAATPEGDPIFDPQNLVYKAHAGIAQAAMNLGDWELAVTHAAEVPDDFVAYEHHHGSAPVFEDNPYWELFWDSDDATLWNTPLANLWPDDPRSPWIKCGEFTAGPRTTPGSSGQISRQGNCGHLDGEFRAESNTIPLYISTKYPTEDDDVPVVKGAEMRLIEAEAALRNNQLSEFKAQVDRARAVYGLGPIPLPTTAGALEFPNAEDDAWSILDRERYLTLHLEGRRLWDMHRWNHPFLDPDADHAMTSRLYDDYDTDLPRMSCYPVADIECDANGDLTCPSLLGT